jgi:hypothetical protein
LPITWEVPWWLSRANPFILMMELLLMQKGDADPCVHQPNGCKTDWEICYLKFDQLRNSGFHKCTYVCSESKRIMERLQKIPCEPFIQSIN